MLHNGADKARHWEVMEHFALQVTLPSPSSPCDVEPSPQDGINGLPHTLVYASFSTGAVHNQRPTQVA